jgi:hypothetical protein
MDEQPNNEQGLRLFGQYMPYEMFPFKLGAVAYLASYGFYFLFLNSYFWDDWVINYQLSADEARQYWKTQLGFFPTNPFVEIDLLQRSPVAFHLLTLLIFFLIPIVFFQISKHISFLSQRQRFYTAVLLLVLPINSARVTMACFRLSYSLLLFLVAWLILVNTRKPRLRLFAIPLFLLSFLAQSLIPFFLLPCAHSVYLAYCKYGKWNHKSVLRCAALILMPFFYYAFVWTFDPPSPERTDYFTPNISGSLRAVMALSSTLILFLYVRVKSQRGKRGWRATDLLALALVLLAVGSFAYMTSGRLVDLSEWMLNFVPGSSGWESRHQLLLGIGFALLVAVLIDSLRLEVQKAAFVGVIVFCIALNMSMSSSYYLDGLKQKEFMSIASTIEELSGDETVVIIDHTDWLNARGREIRSYEWQAMLHKATGGSDIEVLGVPEICSQPENIQPQTVLVIDAPSGSLKSILNRKIGISILRLDAFLCY